MKRRLSKKVGINIKLYRKLTWLALECIRDHVFDRWGDRELNDENVVQIRKEIRDNVEGFLYWWTSEISSQTSDQLK